MIRAGIFLMAGVGCVMPSAAQADSCGKSRDYILENASDLPQKPQVYQQLFKNCLETLQLSNVKDAFILQTGAIAVIPRNDSLSATASTLAQFCTRFPKGNLHFIGRKVQAQAASISRAVRLSTQSTPCQKISGGG
ncbi:MAG: hypothetical protein JWN71_1833 [Xanthobacteraceae bacterium]|nr:hypothetical protein [Xanthobacteraceae bacterium]